jgi:hypothetical protein
MEKHKAFRRKKQKLADLQKSVRKLSTTTTNENSMNSLRKRAEKLLHDGGSATENESDGASGVYDTDATSSSSQSPTDTDSDISTKRHKTVRRKHRKGGKIPTNISFLRYQYKARELKYRDLDLPLLLACELEDLKCELKKSVKSRMTCHKLEHLIKLCYNSKQYKWPAILDWHIAIHDEIKSGRALWSDHCVHVDAATLHAHPQDRPDTHIQSTLNDHRHLYCALFQTGQCSKSTPHQGIFAGKTTQLYHFCQSCWVKSRSEQYHAPSSPDCPYGPLLDKVRNTKA